MAFSQSNARDAQNRKILEEIQMKKQMLLKQGVSQSLGSTINVTTSPSSIGSDGAANSLQRSALVNAQAASAGYFITQDSSFGNLILPVLPRFDNK